MQLRLEELIARGGSARVYRARTADNRVVAVKKSHTNKHVRDPILRHEACVMITLRGHPAISEVYAWGRSQYFEYLALEELGEDLTTLSRLTLRNLVALTCQLLDAVQFIHAHHIVHCDIKPSNVLFQRHPSGVVKLIDFGMAKLYRDPTTLQHRPQTSLNWLHGTKGFASINVHYHMRPSRRDDIVSLSYTVLHLLCGGLPWLNDNGMDDANVLRLKVASPGAVLGHGYPHVFGAFLDYARSLKFDQEPAYTEWRNQFKALTPGITEPPRFSTSDTGDYVGTATWPSLVYPSHVRTPPPSSADDMVWGSDDMFTPMFSWPGPFSIPNDDLVGDEQRTISTSIERISEVPALEKPILYIFNDNIERMVTD
ncbi:kinase-like domain-containing protein [Schizophyllum commune]